MCSHRPQRRLSSSERVLVFSYTDRAPVHMVTIYSHVEPITVQQTKRRPHANGVWALQRVPITRLNSMHECNHTMTGVDRADQLRNNYSARVRSRKYPMVVFCFVFDMAITNSYIYLQLLGRKRTKTHRPMARIEREKLAIRLAFGDGILAPSKSYMAESTQRQLSQENLERLPGGNLPKSRRGSILTGKRQRACGSRGSH